jgi:hypothetical protein
MRCSAFIFEPKIRQGRNFFALIIKALNPFSTVMKGTKPFQKIPEASVNGILKFGLRLDWVIC